MLEEFVKTHVEYDFSDAGYIVQVIQGSDIIDEYWARNSPYDSQVVLVEGGLDVDTIRRYAKRTAKEFAVQYNADDVTRNAEILTLNY